MTRSFTIEEYWRSTFSSVKRIASASFPAGWSSPETPSPWFVEPDLTLRPDCGSPQAPVILVAAPGAVGKSTLARNMCAHTGLMLVDLAKSDTVGGNFLSGGVMKAGGSVVKAWTDRTLGLAIDALDEARLRVTQQSFDDFLKDVMAVTQQNSTPVVLFGRTGMVDECWLWFQENGLKAAIFDIELFDQPRAVQFIESYLRRRADGPPPDTGLAERISRFAAPYRSAGLDFVKLLADASRQTETVRTALEFAGYAPVLEAVGLMLANTPNPWSMGAGVLKARSRDVLFQVVDHILDREQDKLRESLDPAFGSLPIDALYTRMEQRQRLVARLFGMKPPSTPHQVPPLLQQNYEDAVESFLAQHPFLDGTSANVSSAVFSADLLAFALHHNESALRLKGEKWARSHSAPNPFLIDFYEERSPEGVKPVFVDPEHVGLLDASMRARLRANQHATLEFLQEEDGEAASVVLEIVLSRGGIEDTIEERSFRSSVAGTLRLPHKVSRATVEADNLDLELGDGRTCELAAPILLDVGNLRFHAEDIIVSLEATLESHSSIPDDTVALFAMHADTSNIAKVPRVADGVTLSVQWLGAAVYPWTRFVTSPRASEDPSLAEAQRALRRLVMSFRSHSKGQLARFKDKIEHRRMTKGAIGERIRQALLADGVLFIQGIYYILEPDMLGEQLGTDYASLRDKVFSDSVNAYLNKLLSV